MSKKYSDNVIHPPSGSCLPGTEQANPYINYPPNEIKRLMEYEKDKEELEKMESALKQWERIYRWPYYPYRLAAKLRKIAKTILSEISPQPRNIPYYYDEEQPQGYGEIMDSLKNVHDNDDMVRFDIPRQGERPKVDIDTSHGNFLSPKEPVFDAVKPRGDGPDPFGRDTVWPPTGGNNSWFPSNIG